MATVIDKARPGAAVDPHINKRSSQIAAYIKDGPPTTDDLLAGTAGVFKDTSGGDVVLAYNDDGAIVTVALT